MDKEKSKKRIPVSWKDKIITPKEVGPEPPLNKEGFWKKYEPTEFQVEKE